MSKMILSLEANSYISKKLKAWPNVLLGMVSKFVNLINGEVSVIYSSDTKSQKNSFYDFTSELICVDPNVTDRLVVDFINNFLSQSPNNFCLLITDDREKEALFEKSTLEDLRKAIHVKKLAKINFVFLLFTFKVAKENISSKDIMSELKFLLIPAYEGSGYLVWKRWEEAQFIGKHKKIVDIRDDEQIDLCQSMLQSIYDQRTGLNIEFLKQKQFVVVPFDEDFDIRKSLLQSLEKNSSELYAISTEAKVYYKLLELNEDSLGDLFKNTHLLEFALLPEDFSYIILINEGYSIVAGSVALLNKVTGNDIEGAIGKFREYATGLAENNLNYGLKLLSLLKTYEQVNGSLKN